MLAMPSKGARSQASCASVSCPVACPLHACLGQLSNAHVCPPSIAFLSRRIADLQDLLAKRDRILQASCLGVTRWAVVEVM